MTVGMEQSSTRCSTYMLGFYHEQAHTDRDDYIKIMWDNIAQGWQKSFARFLIELNYFVLREGKQLPVCEAI